MSNDRSRDAGQESEAIRGSGGFSKGADVFPVAPVMPVSIETVMMSPGPLMSLPSQSAGPADGNASPSTPTEG